MISTQKKQKTNKNRRIVLCLYLTVNLLVVFLLLAGFIMHVLGSDNIHYYPDYEKIDLQPVVERMSEAISAGEKDPDDYRTILLQTGLGKPAVDELLIYSGFSDDRILEELKNYQHDFFAQVRMNDLKIGIVTASNKIVDEDGRLADGFKIAGLKDGDVLISESTHTFGWRHGHAAIVVDAKNRKILEAALWGYNSRINKIDSWRHYSSFIQLRLIKTPDGKPLTDSSQIGEEIASLAKENANDIPYGPFTGIPVKGPEIGSLEKTQCAHLVWYPYYHFGYDIDADGTWLVTPRDIAASPYFEIVQVYGVDPGNLWP